MFAVNFIAILFLFISGCSLTNFNNESQNENKAMLHLQLGTNYLIKKNYPLALKELLIAEKLDPKNPLVQNHLGLAYLVRNKYELSEKCFKRALELNPSYTDARNNLAQLYIDAGLYDKAIDELNIAVKDLTYSEPEKSWANLGQAYFLKKEYEKARQALLKSLKERKMSCYTMNTYGRTLLELEKFKLASESFDQAIRLCEKNNFDEPSFYAALSFFKLGDNERARARLEEFLNTFPSSQYANKAKDMLEIIK